MITILSIIWLIGYLFGLFWFTCTHKGIAQVDLQKEAYRLGRRPLFDGVMGTLISFWPLALLLAITVLLYQAKK